MRIASLVGKMATGDLISIGLAEGNTIDELLAKYREIVESNGKLVQGKRELHLSEMHLLASATAGGEMKARRRFQSLKPVV